MGIKNGERRPMSAFGLRAFDLRTFFVGIQLTTNLMAGEIDVFASREKTRGLRKLFSSFLVQCQRWRRWSESLADPTTGRANLRKHFASFAFHSNNFQWACSNKKGFRSSFSSFFIEIALESEWSNFKNEADHRCHTACHRRYTSDACHTKYVSPMPNFCSKWLAFLWNLR